MPRHTPTMLALLTLTLGLARPAAAADEGFTPLFNGKDLAGWVTPEDKSLFSVEDGVIVGRTRTKTALKKNEFLVTDKPYTNFLLKAKVKFTSGNSGIQFRSERESNGRVSGPQADVAPDYWGLLYEENRRGMLDQYPKEKAEKLVHKDDWNEFEIEAVGDHVVIKINGTKVVDRTDPKFDKSGIIALQVHAGQVNEVRYKDVMIKVLD